MGMRSNTFITANDSDENAVVIIARKYPGDAITFFKESNYDTKQVLDAALRGVIHAKGTGIVTDSLTKKWSKFKTYECFETTFALSKDGQAFYCYGRIFLVFDTVFYLASISSSIERASEDLMKLGDGFNVVRAAAAAASTEVPARKAEPVDRQKRNKTKNR
jgi:hypothetical protein